MAFLETRGFSVLVRNWRRPEGELDMVAMDGRTCVFVEVRSRTGEDQGHPLESVNPRKRAQIARVAKLFLTEEKVDADGYRFDVIGIVFAPSAEMSGPVLSYVPDAFQIGDAG